MSEQKKISMLVELIVEPGPGTRSKKPKVITNELLEEIEESFYERAEEVTEKLSKKHQVDVTYEMAPINTSFEAFTSWRHDAGACQPELSVFELALGWLCAQGIDPEMAGETAEKWHAALDGAKCVHCARAKEA